MPAWYFPGASVKGMKLGHKRFTINLNWSRSDKPTTEEELSQAPHPPVVQAPRAVQPTASDHDELESQPQATAALYPPTPLLPASSLSNVLVVPTVTSILVSDPLPKRHSATSTFSHGADPELSFTTVHDGHTSNDCQTGMPGIDKLLMDPFALHSDANAHEILRLARLHRNSIHSRHRADRHTHREAAYRLRLCSNQLAIQEQQLVRCDGELVAFQEDLTRHHEQLVVSENDLLAVDTAIGKLVTLIERAGLALWSMNIADRDLLMSDTNSSLDDSISF